MRNLLRILGLYKYSISFWILVIFSFFFLFNNNVFLKSYYFNSSNYISGTIFSLRNSFINYFELKSQNTKILDENNDLFAQILYYESNKKSNADTLNVRYRLISANVINNSINKNENYITLDKGSEDGVEVGMGVISSKGIVGKVQYISDNFSTLISLLNTSYYVSTLIKSTNTLSSLNWDAENPNKAKLLYIPKHINLNEGDSVITSSFNTIYPKGIGIGIIKHINKNINSNFYDIDIELFQSFYNLSHVYIIVDTQKEEKILLELKNNDEE